MGSMFSGIGKGISNFFGGSSSSFMPSMTPQLVAPPTMPDPFNPATMEAAKQAAAARFGRSATMLNMGSKSTLAGGGMYGGGGAVPYSGKTLGG